MKTVEDWKQEWLKLECNTLLEHEANASYMIQQIQLDAMREGMRRAADLAAKGHGNSTAESLCGFCLLTASEQLTIKDL